MLNAAVNSVGNLSLMLWSVLLLDASCYLVFKDWRLWLMFVVCLAGWLV